eukprot:COSAG02_NODE_2965_length_7644_cov_1362.789927_10_plen_272_part_01
MMRPGRATVPFVVLAAASATAVHATEACRLRESGSSSSNLVASADGAELTVGQAMETITFYYNSSAASSSGSSSSASSTAYTGKALATGFSNTCAVVENGSLTCWGSNQYGMLGAGDDAPARVEPSPKVYVDLGTGRKAVGVTVGVSHACAILDEGSLKCWGANRAGQLGDGSRYGSASDFSSTPVSVDLGTGRTAVEVAAGYEHTCAILDDGSLKCWGYSWGGALGYSWLGTNVTSINTPPSTPVNLGQGRTAVSVSAGYQNTCAILDDGS